MLDPSNVCTVVIGRMRLFLTSDGAVEIATTIVLDNILKAYSEPSFVKLVDTGLVKITFIPDGSGSQSSIKGNTANNNGQVQDLNSANGMTLTSLLFVAVGSASIIVFVGSAYLWRRRRQENDDSSASQLAESTLNNNVEMSTRRPASPYSEMVSSSYRLDRLGEMSILSSTNMSPVYEQDHEDMETVVGSLVMSVGGYTTDAGCTDGDDTTESSKYSGHSTPKLMGVRPFPGTIVGDVDMEEVSDSDMDTSGEMTPVKMFYDNNLLLPSGNDQEEGESVDADETLLFSALSDNAGSSYDVESIDSADTSSS